MKKNYTLNGKLGDLAEETGIHIGDGSMNIYKSQNNSSLYTIACHHIDDKMYIDTVVVPLIQKIYGINPKTRMWSKGAYGFRISSASIVSFKHNDLGLPLGKKSNIEIPKIFLSDITLAQRLLRGFFSTDGCLTISIKNNKLYPRLYLSNVSKPLVLQIKILLERMNFNVTMWKTEYPDKKWLTIYKLQMCGFGMLHNWVSKIGFNNPKQVNKLDSLNQQTRFLN